MLLYRYLLLFSHVFVTHVCTCTHMELQTSEFCCSCNNFPTHKLRLPYVRDGPKKTNICHASYLLQIIYTTFTMFLNNIQQTLTITIQQSPWTLGPDKLLCYIKSWSNQSCKNNTILIQSNVPKSNPLGLKK